MSDFYLTDINFEVNALGDLDNISGIENIRKSLFRRLITNKGSIIGRSDFGVGLKNFQNSISNESTKRKLALEIKEQFEKDERISKVLGVQVSQDKNDPSLTNISIRVEIVGLGEQTVAFTNLSEF